MVRFIAWVSPFLASKSLAATNEFCPCRGNAGYSPTNNDVCPGQPTTEYHTTGIDDVKGCALAIAYKDVAADVEPEDFVEIGRAHV